MQQRPLSDSGPGELIDLRVYRRVLWRRRWPILGFCVMAVATTLVLTLRMDKVYESTTTLMAPREGGGGGTGALLRAFSAFGQDFVPMFTQSLTPNRDVLMSVLRSRSLAEAVVQRFGLRERYELRYAGDAIRAVQGMTTVTLSKEGLISVKVEETDPQLAADIANFHVEQLDRLMAQFGMGAASRERVFVAEQLERSQQALVAAETALRNFQERNRAIILQDQTRATIEAAARLKGEIMAFEVQLQVLRNFATDANPEVMQLRRRIEEMKRHLQRVQYGEDRSEARGSSVEPSRQDFQVPFARVPQLGLEMVRLTREVKAMETLTLLLTQQLEQVKIAEAKDTPMVQVLDRAVPADRASRPKLRLNLAIAGAASLLLAVVSVLAIDGRRLRRAA